MCNSICNSVVCAFGFIGLCYSRWLSITSSDAFFHGIADSMSVWNLLREFRIRKVHMAVVLNEYGGTVGVCALNTLLLIYRIAYGLP